MRRLVIVFLVSLTTMLFCQEIEITEEQRDNINELLNLFQDRTFLNLIEDRAKAGTILVNERKRVKSNTDFIKKIKFDKNPEIYYSKRNQGKYQLAIKLYIDAYELRVEWWSWNLGIKYSDHITTNAKITAIIFVDISVTKNSFKIATNYKYEWRSKPKPNFHGIKLDFTKLMEGPIIEQLDQTASDINTEFFSLINTYK